MVRISDRNLNMQQIADSGQIFRFNQIGDNEWSLRALDKMITVTGNEDGSYNLSCTQTEYDNFWKHYFDMETDYSRFIAAVPEDDEFLQAAVKFAYGIRILNQDPWEMLISFIISQRKSIPAIKTSIEKLCDRFGDRGAFPTPAQLASADMDGLYDCSLGYRAPYIYEAAREVACGNYRLEEWKNLADEELRAELLRIKGVGIKVANCVMLFGYHRIAAFPVDVWIGRIVEEKYGGEFPIDKYDGFAGVIQQYMFYFGRNSIAF